MKLQIITIVLLLTISDLLGKSIDNIKMLTENASSNMIVDGKLTGRSIEILDAMLKQMKSEQSLKDVRMTTWARAYSIAQKKKNAMVFSTARTKEREKLFKWVGPISQSSIGIIARKRKNIKINKISDLSKYRIGAVLKDIGGMLLLSNGVKKDIIHYTKGNDAVDMSFKKMDKNIIDVFAYGITSLSIDRRYKGFDKNNYEVVYILRKVEAYFAFNKNTDDVIINKWQKALDEIKANGSHARILKKY